MLPHRRHHRKSSTTSTEQHQEPPSSPIPHGGGGISDRSDRSHGSGGGWFASARRRWGGKKGSDSENLLLPTTFSTQKRGSSVASSSVAGGGGGHSSTSPAAAFNPTTKSCNNFLMGGHYYPGKDKKRRTMRKRTLWYRIFCASPLRKACSILFVTYVAVYHAIVPGGNYLIEVGKTMSANGGVGIGGGRSTKTNWLQYDSSLIIPNLKEELSINQRIGKERNKGGQNDNSYHQLHMKILEGVAPNWFHRNDLKKKEKTVYQTIDEVPQEKEPNNEKPRKPKEHNNNINPGNSADDSNNIPNNATSKQAKLHSNTTTEDQQRRLFQVKGDDYTTVRTIHNMDQLTSSCPVTLTSSSQQQHPKWQTTLVIQTSLTRLWILNETCQRWKDPIIAVAFVKQHDIGNGSLEESKERALQQSTLMMTQIISSCPNVNLIQYIATKEESTVTKSYPVNKLRNIGLDAVTTSHILVADVDFVPSQDLHSTIANALQKQHLMSPTKEEENHQALIVPAFERKAPPDDGPCQAATSSRDDSCAKYLKADSGFIPKTFTELQECYNSKECIVFQSEVNWEGHYSTRSEQWLERKWYEDDEEEEQFRSLPCFHTARYEPYVVLRWCPGGHDGNIHNKPIAPYYDERFHGYGKNKIELVSHLRKSGYRFNILPEGFIVHNPHHESAIKETWNDRSNSDLHANMDKLYTTFLAELDTKYRHIHNITVKLCKHQ